MKWTIFCGALLGILALSTGFKLFDRTKSNDYGFEKRGRQEVRLAEKRGRRQDVVSLIADRIDQQLMNCYYYPRLDDYVYTNRDILEVLVTLLREKCPENGGYTDGYSNTPWPSMTNMYPTTNMYPYGVKRTVVEEFAEFLKQREFDSPTGPPSSEENESYSTNSGPSPTDEEFSEGARPTELPSDLEWK